MRTDLLTLAGAAALALGLSMSSFAGPPSDIDGDGSPNIYDNCITIPNGPLAGGCSANEDSDEDGYGNTCDADFNNDGAPGFDDLTIMLNNIGNGSADPQLDLNCDGAPGFDDLTWTLNHIGQGMGTGDSTSALGCAAPNVKGTCPPL